jgi:two-component system, sensor histidine kinase PdtaS
MKNNFNLFCFLLLSASYCGYSQSQSPKKSIDDLRKNLRTTTIDTSKVEIYTKLAENYIFYKTDSLKYFANQAYDLSSKINYQKGIGKSLNLLGNVAQNENNYPDAISKFKKANAIFEKLNDESNQAATLHNLGGIYIRIRALDSSKIVLSKSLSLAKKVNDKSTLAKTNYQLGNLEKANRKFDVAIEYYKQALSYSEIVNDKISIANAYGGMGQIYGLTKDPNKEVEYYKKSISIFRSINNKQNLAVLLSNLGSTYYDMGNFDESAKCLQEAISIKRKMGNNRSTAMTLGALGNLYSSTKSYKKAKEKYEESLSMLPLEDKETQFGLLYMIGLQDYEQKNYKLAKDYFDKAILLSKNSNIDKISMSELLKTYALTQEKLNDFQSALLLYKESTELKDSVNNTLNEEKINKLKTQFEVVEKEKSIAKLNIENKKKEINVANKEKQLAILLASILVSTLLVFFFYYRFKSKQKLSKNLQLKNEELNTNKLQLEAVVKEKEILLKEVHHRVKNNLQLVLSLLNIQAREYNNEEVDLFLEKGEARIASMALIHQTLYTSDKISNVNIKDYIEKLLKSIFISFDIDQENFRYEIESEELNFDIQTAVPLGLIINELVCNALKHAFIDKNEGLLKVKLKHFNAQYQLIISDNGIGLNNQTKKINSVGLELVSILSQQLNGNMETIVNNGTTFTLNFNEIDKTE